MNRRILLQVTAPAFLIGLLLLAACIGGAYSSYRLQRNLDTIRNESIVNLQAAEELEIHVRQLRFHSFRYLIDPSGENAKTIADDRDHFHALLISARRSSRTPEELHDLDLIETGFRKYEREMEQLGREAVQNKHALDFRTLDQAHPIRFIVDPCHDLLRISQERMSETFQESNDVNQQARLVMLLLGICGPIGGLLCGYGIARGLSRSIYNLSVRVQDISERLQESVPSVTFAADGDLSRLDQQLQRVVARVHEVVERAQRQQHDMLRAEQLSAVGQLAASVAHEVRNPLTAVKMLVEAALRSANRKPLTLDDLQVIHAQVARLEQTVQSFLDFARLPAPRRIPSDLRRALDQAVDLVRARARQQGVAIVVCYPDVPVTADVDTGQLGTVLVNLLLNALDALPDGGSVSIHLETPSASEIRLNVADTGAGIPQDMVARLFTPFASSKPTGTGLGLSISRRIIEEHGGALSAANRPEGGASFTITLPAAPAPAGAGKPESSSEIPAAGAEPERVAAGDDHANAASYR